MANTNYDSEFCGKLPIHHINLIQPHGVLLVVDAHGWQIVQVSDNAPEVFGMEVNKILRQPLASFLDAQTLDKIREQISKGLKSGIPATLGINGKQYLSITHYKERYFITEIDLVPFERPLQETFMEVYQEIKLAILGIETGESLKELGEYAVREIKRLTGFDKVMLYKFDEDWNGTVLAEAKEEGMEAYLGLTFPASDIPHQARQLYYKSAYRYIPTRDYVPVKLNPVINPITNTFIDLSGCNLRAVAGVHLEYLKNMGVVASLSARVLLKDKLWGLISCHHRTSKYINHQVGYIIELLCGILSYRIDSLLTKEYQEEDAFIRDTYTRIVGETYRTGQLEKSLLSEEAGILTLLDASGVVLVRNSKVLKAGIVPEQSHLDELLLWIQTLQVKNTFQTDSLPTMFDQAFDYKDIASGLLVLTIDAESNDYILVFRPEIKRHIDWGGDPAERIQFSPDAKEYHPRNSFKQWRQQVEGTARPWRNEQVKVAEKLRSFIYEFKTSYKDKVI